MRLQMPADLLRVFTGASALVSSWRRQKDKISELKGGKKWQMRDGNCKELSISSDLGALTTCQKHLPINLYPCIWVCARGHVSVREHDSCLCYKLIASVHAATLRFNIHNHTHIFLCVLIIFFNTCH